MSFKTESGMFTGLLNLFGAILGVVCFALIQPVEAFLLFLSALIIVYVIRLIAETLFQTRPIIGAYALETWGISGTLVVALGTVVILVLTSHAATEFEIPDEKTDAMKGVLVGAFASYFTNTWFKSIDDGDSWFSVPTAFRSAAKALREAKGFEPQSYAARLCTLQNVPSNGEFKSIKGFGYSSRRVRSERISNELA